MESVSHAAMFGCWKILFYNMLWLFHIFFTGQWKVSSASPPNWFSRLRLVWPWKLLPLAVSPRGNARLERAGRPAIMPICLWHIVASCFVSKATVKFVSASPPSTHTEPLTTSLKAEIEMPEGRSRSRGRTWVDRCLWIKFLFCS